jgi:hypothetical protein
MRVWMPHRDIAIGGFVISNTGSHIICDWLEAQTFLVKLFAVISDSAIICLNLKMYCSSILASTFPFPVWLDSNPNPQLDLA